MKLEDFSNSTAGRCIRTESGYFAFHPEPLPPAVELDWPLASLLSEADRAVAELSVAGQLLPKPHLLIRPYLRREAIESSRIEDTIADMQQLVLFEAGAYEVGKPNVAEVSNYVRAMELGLKRMQELPISSRLIRELHAVLMEDVRGGQSPNTPGEFRRSQNWIGPPGATLAEATYVPPPVEVMHRALGQWEDYLHQASHEPPLVKAAILHYQFEAIHPFLDGNGRIGRLLITLFLCDQRCLSQPLLNLSGFFDQTRDDYYRRLLAVSQRGDWRGWIEYFLRGVRRQAKGSLEDTRRLVALYESRREQLARATRPPQAAGLVLDELFSNPVFSIARHCRQTGASYLAVRNAVEFWEEHALLREISGRKRNRIYLAQEILDATSE